MTEADFVNTVAENLGIAAVGQSLSDDDASVIRRRMAGTFARLAREELTTVASTSDIPDGQSLALADIVAFDCAVAFSISGQALADLAGLAAKARDSIRMVVSERPTSDTLAQPRWWGPTRAGTYNGTG